jgi:hypothetical protein
MRPITSWALTLLILLLFRTSILEAQETYPVSNFSQSSVPPSPDGQAWASYGNAPVNLATGTTAISIPVYTLKCGSLSVPITLSYNYNGLFPLQDAGWVGLGWNLNAGGAITRQVEDNVDNSENTGYNYGQYNLLDSIGGPDVDNFLTGAYDNLLGNGGKVYDLAPDIYDAEFNGYSDKFVWVNGKAYMMTWDKDFGVTWPSGVFTITTADGTVYSFGNTEATADYVYGGADSTLQVYTSTWNLTQIVSADHKDTIQFNYSSYTWQQQPISYQTSYVKSITLGEPDLGPSPIAFQSTPSVTGSILKSIVCRNNRINFVLDAAARTDVTGTYPRLREIDVIDSLTGVTVKKNRVSYEYFGQTSTSPALYERLALKTYTSVNSLNSTDSLTYTFKYVNEYGAFPAKSTNSIDWWGYCNGDSLGTSILPTNSSLYYYPVPTGTNMGADVRTPNFTYCSYGALDTIVYPTGGYTAFQYGQNNYYSSGSVAGPGICVQSVTTVSNNPTSPQSIQKVYTYLADNGNCSGVLGVIPYIYGSPFVISNTTGVYNFVTYITSSSSAGIGGAPSKFYYSKVTETVSSNNEIHKTDHYFTSFPELFQDVRQTEQIDYSNTPGTTIFTPVTETVINYSQSSDTVLATASPIIDTEYINGAHFPKSWYAYQAAEQNWSWSWWICPTSQQTTQYDVNGNSLVQTTTYSYNSTTRNLAYMTQTTSDGQTVKQKFKYPEDYSSALTANMVTARVLSPVLEKQTWMYPNASDSLLISGAITQYDQTIFKPTTIYTVETTKPIPVLNNETISGGLYTSLLSDSRYIMKQKIQYDQYNNVNVTTKSADMNMSIIWDYRHGEPIAKVQNAAQSDIAYTSFEADGQGNWSYTGADTLNPASPTGNHCYNIGQSGGAITKAGLTQATTYVISYWITGYSSLLHIPGSLSTVTGKTINGWTYVECKFTNQGGLSLTGTGYIDELRLYPANAQMATFTYQPSVGVSTQCDVDNRATYYQYDGFNRVKVVLDQDHNIIKTMQYHTIGETVE